MMKKSKTALFIGNRDRYQVKEADIEKAIINAIEDGIEVFLNGGQGYFDNTCASIVHRLKKRYPHIKSICHHMIVLVFIEGDQNDDVVFI